MFDWLRSLISRFGVVLRDLFEALQAKVIEAAWIFLEWLQDAIFALIPDTWGAYLASFDMSPFMDAMAVAGYFFPISEVVGLMIAAFTVVGSIRFVRWVLSMPLIWN